MRKLRIVGIALVSLAALAVPASSQPSGHPYLQGEAALARAKASGIDIGRVIETVSHRMEPARGGLLARDRGYRARFDAQGFALKRRRAAPFMVETSGATVGQRRLALGRGSWRAHRNAALRALAPGLDERVIARDGRLEWDFVLQDAPTQAGDLTIEADVSARGRRAGSFLRWPTGWRMGALVVREAGGRELYRALPGLEGRRLSLTVPERILHRAAYPLMLDPVVSLEYPASEAAYVTAPGAQVDPAVAFDGSNYLVVWTDGRLVSWAPDIHAARVSPAGNVLDPGGIAISTAADEQSAPAVVSDGTGFFVAWEDHHSGSTYGARVSSGGSVLDPTGIRLSTSPSTDPAVAFDGTNYLVAWNDLRTGLGNIYGTRVSRGGGVLDPNGIAISTAPNDQSGPQVAFDGSNYLVAWNDNRSGAWDVYGARVTPGGNVLDSGGIPISVATGSQLYPGLAFDGANYLVAWSDNRTGGGYDIYGARVSPGGAVLDPAGVGISTAPNSELGPAVAFDGTNYLVVWTDNRSGQADVYGARVSPEAVVLDPAGLPIRIGAGFQTAGGLAFDGTNYLVAWTVGTDYLTVDVYSTRVRPDGTVVDPSGFETSGAATKQSTPAVAFDGTNYLVVWQEFRRADSDVYGARISQAGAVLDGTGIPIVTTAGWEFSPDVAFDGTNYLVAWSDDNIRAARVSTAGTVLDPAGFTISATNYYRDWFPQVAFDGTNYLVVWETEDGAYDIWGARVSRAGTVLDPSGIAIASWGGVQGLPAIAFDGTNFLVVWHGGPDRNGIYAARVSRAGIVLDGDGIAVSTGGANPELAFDGANYLAVWYAGGFETTEIYGARVSPAGVVVDPVAIPITAARYDQWNPTVAFNGANYLVAWQDRRTDPPLWDVYGARVTRGGNVLDPAGFAISAGATDEAEPSAARGPGDRVVVAYSRYAPEAPWGAQRAFARFVDEGPPPAPPPPPPPLPPPPPPRPPPPPPPPPPVVQCRVPKVVGLRLATARTRIRRARCTVGRVRRTRSRRVGRVLSQSPRAGRRLAQGARVNLVVGRR